MPEGDTVTKLARRFHTELCGRAVRSLRARRIATPDLTGACLQRVHAHGKHLYLEFDNGLTLRSHLGMYGAWHRYRPGEVWRKPARQASVVLEVQNAVYVCFNARQVELLATGGFRARDQRQRLGPDLADANLEVVPLVARARHLVPADAPLVDVLLDQRVAAGIGNVYKSELLFLARRAPATPLGAVDDASLAVIYQTAGELLRRNLGGGRRRTRFVADGAGELWVYRRHGLPCLACGRPVRRALMGKGLRSTYWCAGCQPG